MNEQTDKGTGIGVCKYSIVPNPHKYDAPYYTTRDKHEDLETAFIEGYKQANQWIDVKERLPEIKGKYLVVIRDALAPKKWVAILAFRDNEWQSNDLDNLTWVTHWQHLPQPPQQ